MKKLFLFLLLFHYNRLPAQETNYLKYHQRVATAEDALVLEQFEQALNIYKETFKVYENPFAVDAFYACQIAAYLNNKQDFDSLISLCFKKGVSYKLLSKSPLTKKFLSGRDSIKYQNLHKANYQIYLSGLNLKLREEFYKRYLKEQASKQDLPKFKSATESNYDRIEHLAKAGNFPGRAVIGIDFGDLYSSDMTIGNSFVFATLLHYPYSFCRLKEHLFNEIKKGNISPRDVAYLYSFEQNKETTLYKYYTNPAELNCKTTTCYNLFGKKSNDIESVNKERYEIGLCKYETDTLKLDFKRKFDFVIFSFAD